MTSLAPPEVGAPELEFRVAGVEAAEHTVAPTLAFELEIDAGGREIRSLALNAQLRIGAPRRSYDEAERGRLFELFGPPEAWGRSLRSIRWATLAVTVPPFTGRTTAEIQVPCTYDFDVVATKYLHALGDGEVPLELYFSGTVFYAGAGGRLQVVRLSWDREARCSMPVRVWREALERAFPGTAWLRVRRDLFDRLQAYKSEQTLLTWDAVVERLLEEAE